MIITLTNDFHNTEATLRIKHSDSINIFGDATLSPGQAKKAQKALCGTEGCQCSGGLGTRGRQEFEIIHERQDGSVQIQI